MKKLVLLLVVLMLLVIPAGCKKEDNNNGNNNNNTNTNTNTPSGNFAMTCTMKDESGTSTVNVAAKGDVMTRIVMSMIMETGDPAVTDMVLGMMEEMINELNATEGLKASLKKTADGKGIILDYDFDLGTATMEGLQDVFPGLDDEDWKALSLKAYREELTSQGFTCK